MIGQEAERLENTSVQCAREPKCREWADQEKFQAARKRKIELTPSARWQTSTGKTNDRTSWVHTPDETTAQRELKFEVENSKYRSERNRERLAYIEVSVPWAVYGNPYEYAGTARIIQASTRRIFFVIYSQPAAPIEERTTGEELQFEIQWRRDRDDRNGRRMKDVPPATAGPAVWVPQASRSRAQKYACIHVQRLTSKASRDPHWGLTGTERVLTNANMGWALAGTDWIWIHIDCTGR